MLSRDKRNDSEGEWKCKSGNTVSFCDYTDGSIKSPDELVKLLTIILDSACSTSLVGGRTLS